MVHDVLLSIYQVNGMEICIKAVSRINRAGLRKYKNQRDRPGELLLHFQTMISGIEHVAIASPNPKKLAGWYVEMLGFAVVYDSGRTLIVKAPNGSMIEITTAEGDRPEQGMKLPGLRHVALAVEDFDAEYGRLKASGARFLDEPHQAKGVKVVYFEDADGNYLHLIQREKAL